MSSTSESTAAYLSFAGSACVQRTANAVVVSVGSDTRLVLECPEPGALRVLEAGGPQLELALLCAARAPFEWMPELETLRVTLGPSALLAPRLAQRGFELQGTAATSCTRSLLAQHPEPWLSAGPAPSFPLAYTVSNGKRHPRRAPKPRGVVYERHLPELDTTLSLRVLDPERDLAVFHRWMNDPRIAPIWELAGTRDQHLAYFQQLAADPHTLPLIGEFDGESFGYFELYWAKEDRIAPFYDVAEYDRGVHVLSGESKYRGPRRVAAWLSALAHYAFLDDSRTTNLVAEPRADNSKMIAYFAAAGFHRIRNFDFPHKRAAMMVLPRDVFFTEHCP